MTWLDWLVLTGTIAFIALYGWWKNRKSQALNDYLRGGNEMPWHTIGLSIMATQASAITFLSTPGLAYEKGLRFVQFYFGLPLAMIVISAFIVPIYYRLKVFTAYEYLEQRFDLRVRLLGASLFLIQRGLAAGITIYAPAIILASIMGWSLQWTNLIIGGVVILYTVSGGTKAVSQTQKQQMIVIMAGMLIAAGLIYTSLPKDVGLFEAAQLAGALGRMNAVDFNFDLNHRYNLWSGLLGGFFLALSYFGTDQSQVQRYLTGRSLRESRLGLLLNGILKIPMQFMILWIGILVFVFYLFVQPPLSFNTPALKELKHHRQHAAKVAQLQTQYDKACKEQQKATIAFLKADRDWRRVQGTAKSERHTVRQQRKIDFQRAARQRQRLRTQANQLLRQHIPQARKSKEADYIFIHFVVRWFPAGLLGLLLAVIKRRTPA
ncbi:MAG: sodium:solute symporter, partial [Myxococcota bacterium]